MHFIDITCTLMRGCCSSERRCSCWPPWWVVVVTICLCCHEGQLQKKTNQQTLPACLLEPQTTLMLACAAVHKMMQTLACCREPCL